MAACVALIASRIASPAQLDGWQRASLSLRLWHRMEVSSGSQMSRSVSESSRSSIRLERKQLPTLHHITSHYYITLHHITLHHITSHFITLHYITSHYITLHHITSHCITFTSHFFTLHHISSHYITLYHITSRTGSLTGYNRYIIPLPAEVVLSSLSEYQRIPEVVPFCSVLAPLRILVTRVALY